MSDLARANAAESGEFLYESTGKREAQEPLKVGNGAFKGQLHYVAEFVPAYAVRGIGFDARPSELEQVVEHDHAAAASDDDEGETVHDTDSEEDAAVPEGITAASPVDENDQGPAEGDKSHRRVKSTDTTISATSAKSPTDPNGVYGIDHEKRPEEQGIEMSKEELLKHRTSP